MADASIDASIDAGPPDCTAYLVPLVWQVEVIDDNGATPDLDINPGILALAIDAMGRAQVAYSGAGRNDPHTPIHYAIRDGEIWSRESFHPAQDLEEPWCCNSLGSLAVDPAGIAHLVFSSNTGPEIAPHLHYAQRLDEGWDELPEADPAGFATAAIDLAMNAEGTVAFLLFGLDFEAGTGLQRLAAYGDAGWAYEELDDEQGVSGRLFVDTDGARYVAYSGSVEAGTTDSRPLLLASDASGQWVHVVLADPYPFDRISLAVSSDRTVHVCTNDQEESTLRCHECAGGECTARTIGDRPSVTWPSVRLDAWDRAHLTYEVYDQASSQSFVRHAALVGDEWEAEDIESTPSIDRPQIAIAADGTLHVVYWSWLDDGTMQVRHAWAASCED